MFDHQTFYVILSYVDIYMPNFKNQLNLDSGKWNKEILFVLDMLLNVIELLNGYGNERIWICH